MNTQNNTTQDQTNRLLSIPILLEHLAKSYPKSVAVYGLDQKPLTYPSLLSQVNYVSRKLNSANVGRNDRVAIVLPNGAEMAVTFLAVSSCATSAPLNPGYNQENFEFYLSDLNAKALIILNEAESKAEKAAQTLGIPIIRLLPKLHGDAGTFELTGHNINDDSESTLAEPEDTALVLHTSGTTSRPKIVPLSHINICTSAGNISQTLALSQDDICLNVMPLFHIHGLIGAVLSSISAAAGVCCMPGFDSNNFFKWMEIYRPTWYTAVPTIHQEVLNQTKVNRAIAAQSNLRFIRSSSAALPARVMEGLESEFGVPVIESYGMTEAAHQMSSNPLPPQKRKPNSVGIAAGPSIAIMDKENNLLSRGETGEIVIRGQNVTSGYENNPEANSTAFSNGWFRTGDQGSLDSEGYLFITGRLKEIINRGGEKIAPYEVDKVFLSHPAVAQAVTFSVPHPTLGEDVASAVVLNADLETAISEKELRDYGFSKLADYQVPSQVIFVDKIPKGSTGKLQRIGLVEKIKSHLHAEYVAPRNALETKLANIWSQVLKVENVGICDNFFALGGDSLLAARLFTQVNQLVGRRLPLSLLFRAPTIKELVDEIQNGETLDYWSPIVSIQTEGEKPPLFFVHAHGGNVVDYYQLAKHLGNDRPFYGIQAQGLNGKDIESRTIESMASFYLEEILKEQPDGPYFVGGWCMGGILAYEIARQLSEQGKEVAFLAMVQSTHPEYPKHNSHSKYLKKLQLRILDRMDQEWNNYIEVNPGAKFSYTKQRIKRLLQILLISIEKLMVVPLSKLNIILPHTNAYTLRSLEKAHDHALNNYRPRPYSGPVTLFRSQVQPRGVQKDPMLGWQGFLQGKLDIFEIPGHRVGMLSEPRVQFVAEKMKSCLHQAQQKQQVAIKS